MSRNGIGGNAGPTPDELAEDAEKVDRARKFIYIISELNHAAAAKQDVSAREKEIKTALKGNGVPPKALAIARKVKADPKGDIAYSVASQIIHNGAHADELSALDDLRDERREIALREKDLRGAATEAGINLKALQTVRGMQQLDTIERDEFFDAMIEYPKWLKFW